MIEEDYRPSREVLSWAKMSMLPDPKDRDTLLDFVMSNRGTGWLSEDWDAEYVRYLIRRKLSNAERKGKSERWRLARGRTGTDEELQAWGEANGVPPRPGETMDAYRVRVRRAYERGQRGQQQ